MTPEEYIEFNDFKPLTKKELKKGKNSLKIYGTDDLMPWTEVYTYIAVGKSMVDLAEKYGHGRKIALWAIEDNIQYIPNIADAFEGEVQQRETMKAIEAVNPDVHKTILEAANEYAPDTAKNVAILSSALIKKATKIVNTEDCSSSDLLNVAKAVQTMTDTTGHTQRFSSAMSISGSDVQVTNFEFVLDAPPEPKQEDAIDVEVEEKK